MKAIVIGAGITGTFASLDLATRGVETVLLERAPSTSGATIAIGGVIHSGARFAALNDTLTKTCKTENEVWRHIGKDFLKGEAGYFIRLDKDDKYAENWWGGLKKAGILAREVPVSEIKATGLKRAIIQEAVETPEAIIDLREFLFHLLGKAVESGVLYINNASWQGNYLGNGEYRVKVKRGSSELEIDGYVINATGSEIPNVVKSLTGKVKKYEKFRGSHLGLRVQINGVLEKMRAPGFADLFSSFNGQTLITPTLEPFDGLTINEKEYQTLMAGARELFDVGPSDVTGSLSAPRLSYDQGASLMKTDYLEEIDGLINAYSSNFTCARLVAEKAADLLSIKLGIKKKSVTSSIQIRPETAQLNSTVNFSPSDKF
ncbi:MAG: FAD-dependent oxidoreductase [Thermoprotei archaeon]